MKTLKILVATLAVFTLLSSCSQDNETTRGSEDKVTLTFGAILNDLVANRMQSKQAISELPECSDDDPVFIEIILTRNGSAVVGSIATPFRIDLVAGQIYTKDVPELELDPAMYRLDYLTVHNAGGDVIWIAPQTNSPLGEFVEMGLPMDIDLRAGVKKYVDVPVLCYDDRDVNEYGYLFFELDTNRAIKFCIFGNYCPPSENDRHYPASYSVSVWSGTDATGTPLYTNVYNQTGYYDNGDYYAEPLCVALPDTDGEDQYYFEITLRSSDEYGQVEERIIREGILTDTEVKTLFVGDNMLDYYHFREGCEGDDSPPIFQDPDDEADFYKACLTPVNGTQAIGFAYLRLEGNVLQTTVLASNLESNKSHLQHIHANATCDDAGAPILSLDNEDGTWPVATSPFGDLIYHRTFTLGVDGIPSLATLQPLENRTINIHGKTVNGSYNVGIVVACGPIDKLE